MISLLATLVAPKGLDTLAYEISFIFSLNSRRAVQDLFTRTSRAYPTPPQVALGRPSYALDFDTRPEKKENEVHQEQELDHDAEREYDPYVSYEHDLLPPSPQVNGGIHKRKGTALAVSEGEPIAITTGEDELDVHGVGRLGQTVLC